MKGLKHEPEKTAPTSPTLSELMDSYRESIWFDYFSKMRDALYAPVVLPGGVSPLTIHTTREQYAVYSVIRATMKSSES